jgi:hypothetical protein
MDHQRRIPRCVQPASGGQDAQARCARTEDQCILPLTAEERVSELRGERERGRHTQERARDTQEPAGGNALTAVGACAVYLREAL